MNEMWALLAPTLHDTLGIEYDDIEIRNLGDFQWKYSINETRFSTIDLPLEPGSSRFVLMYCPPYTVQEIYDITADMVIYGGPGGDIIIQDHRFDRLSTFRPWIAGIYIVFARRRI